jgi:hypothetical protein
VIFLIGIAAFFYFAPKILRAMKAKVWLAWKKLNGPADRGMSMKLPIALPARLASVFSRENILGETIAWAAPCISGRGRGIPANLSGALVATNEEPRKLVFVARKNGRPFARTIDLEDLMVAHEPRFLSENLVISPVAGNGPKYLFIFPRPHAGFVEQIVENLRERLGQQGPTGFETRLEPADLSS